MLEAGVAVVGERELTTRCLVVGFVAACGAVAEVVVVAPVSYTHLTLPTKRIV